MVQEFQSWLQLCIVHFALDRNSYLQNRFCSGMNTLQRIEQQLASALAGALEGASSLDRQHPQLLSAAPLTTETPASVSDVLTSIERLQLQLRVITQLIAAQANDAPNAHNILDMQDAVHALGSVGAQDAVDGTADAVSDADTEMDDEMEQLTSVKTEKQEIQQPAKKILPQEAAKRFKQLRNSTKRFADLTKKAEMLDEGADTKQLQLAMGHVVYASTSSIVYMVKFLSDGGVPSVICADMFVGAAVRLPGIAMRIHPAKLAKKDKQWISKMLKNIEKILLYANRNSKLPSALSDSRLQTVHNRLKDHAGGKDLDRLQKMKGFLESVRARKGAREPDHISPSLERLADDYHQDFRLYHARLHSGKAPPRNEEQWALFAEISEVFAEWIRLADLAQRPHQLPRVFTKFERQLTGFSHRHKGRVPNSLLQ